MNSFIKNLLPQDTRPLEILSGISLAILAISFFMFPGIKTGLVSSHPIQFWGAITAILAFIQLGAIITHPNHLYARIAGLWGAGCFWVFFAFNGSESLNSIVIAVMGVSCMIAFVINSIIISEIKKNKGDKWKH